MLSMTTAFSFPYYTCHIVNIDYAHPIDNTNSDRHFRAVIHMCSYRILSIHVMGILVYNYNKMDGHNT